MANALIKYYNKLIYKFHKLVGKDTMGKKQKEQPNQEMSSLEVGKQFLAAFDKMPYSNDRLGQSFVVSFKKPPPDKKK